MTLFGSLLVSRLFLLLKPVIIGHKTSVQENKELLGHYAWHRNCHRFALVYLAHIVANLMQLFLFQYSIYLVFLVSFLVANAFFNNQIYFRQTYFLAFLWVL